VQVVESCISRIILTIVLGLHLSVSFPYGTGRFKNISLIFFLFIICKFDKVALVPPLECIITFH